MPSYKILIMTLGKLLALNVDVLVIYYCKITLGFME